MTSFLSGWWVMCETCKRRMRLRRIDARRVLPGIGSSYWPELMPCPEDDCDGTLAVYRRENGEMVGPLEGEKW